ncbi:ADP-ribosyltransferase [Marinilactibacillus sp. GCM10026970]|uniref:ADP-ribosyltransferase n=1 Tax=Marinilactibacillus sp. GCM10026970 TaxID=3252642 RepID=UPI00361F68D0
MVASAPKLSILDKARLYNPKTGYIKTANSFRINQALRTNNFDSLNSESQETIELLDTKVKEFTLDSDIIATRYEKPAMLADLLKQNNLLDEAVEDLQELFMDNDFNYSNPGYTSASLLKDANVMSNRPIEVAIKLPKGHSLYLTDNVNESEVILKRNGEYRVTNFEIIDQKLKLTMEVVVDG